MHLITQFIYRFNDISVTIRIKCVQYSMHFLINHPELRKEITDTLKLRQHDSEELVRQVSCISSKSLKLGYFTVSSFFLFFKF